MPHHKRGTCSSSSRSYGVRLAGSCLVRLCPKSATQRPLPLPCLPISLSFHQLVGLDAESLGKLTERGHMRLGKVAFYPIHGVFPEAGLRRQLLLSQRLPDSQILEPFADVDHNLNC